MNIMSLQELHSKRTQNGNKIIPKELKDSIADCVKRVSEQQGISEEAAGVLIANALDYGDVEKKADELLHGKPTSTEDRMERFSRAEIYRMGAAMDELIKKQKNHDCELTLPILEDTLEKHLIKPLEKLEGLSEDAAKILLANVLYFDKVIETILFYGHYMMTGEKSLPNNR